MAKSKKINKSASTSNKKPIEQYEHKDKVRVNNPPVGLVNTDTDDLLGPSLGIKYGSNYQPFVNKRDRN